MRCVSGNWNSARVGVRSDDDVFRRRELLRGRQVLRRVGRRPGLQAVAQYQRVERRLPARLLHDRDAGARLPRRRTPPGDDALRHDQAQRLLISANRRRRRHRH